MTDALPRYAMVKRKLRVPRERMGAVEKKFPALFPGGRINRADGVRVDLPTSWVHLRKSNTEPIVRVYTEARSRKEALILSREAARGVRAILARKSSR
jgi:phosphomannomutase